MSTQATPLYLVYSGDALDDLVYRIVERCPPTVADFLSYEAAGRRYDRRDFFKGTGISMHTSKARSRRILQTYRVGVAIATLEIRSPSIVWSRTGGRDHITVWAPPKQLLDLVVQCENDE